MRYPDGGGLTARGRSRREQVRLEAAEMFTQDADATQIARLLRVRTGTRRAMSEADVWVVVNSAPAKHDQGGIHLPTVKVGCQRLNGQKRTEMMY
jgi:hypothetical protein